jgi:hypothetical protein
MDILTYTFYRNSSHSDQEFHLSAQPLTVAYFKSAVSLHQKDIVMGETLFCMRQLADEKSGVDLTRNYENRVLFQILFIKSAGTQS